MKLINGLLVTFLAFGGPVWAQETSFFAESDELVVESEGDDFDPTTVFTEDEAGLTWGGSVSSGASWSGSWTGTPDVNDLKANYVEALGYNLATTLALDARPSSDFRFHFSLKAGAPFTNDAGIPNLKIWEMYTDVTLADTVFLRFGKQSAAWGTAYFYSPGDVISLTAKDVTDPTASREGPVALSATLPVPDFNANLNGYVLLRDDYFPATGSPTLADLGYALQADILLGEAQLSLGGFYQKDNAPKAVATINTGLGFLPIPIVRDISVFSEGIVLWGADVLKGEGTRTLNLGPAGSKTVFNTISTWEEKAYMTGTVGGSYSNSDLNLSLRAEYWYNPFGSAEEGYAQTAFNTFALGQTTATKTLVNAVNTSGRDYGYGDVANPGIHNLTATAGLSQLFGTDVNFSVLTQTNLSDASGWVKPSFSYAPFDGLSFTAGWTQVWGSDDSQFPLQFQNKRVSLNAGVSFGTGRF